MSQSISQQQEYTSMMKFTMDGRPYIKDIHDLLGALMSQVALGTHRYLFRNYLDSFTSEDAIVALGKLRFTHTVRAPDPNDPMRQICTRTTTTFNMARDMAKSLCQQFLSACLIENATDSQIRSFQDKGIWRLTPKGVNVFLDFAIRTETSSPTQQMYTDRMRCTEFQVILIERSPDDDKMLLSRASMVSVFRIMVYDLCNHPNMGRSDHSSTKSTVARRNNSVSSNSSISSGTTLPSGSASGSSQLSSYNNERLFEGRILASANFLRSGSNSRTILSTQLCCDWLSETCTLASRDEAEEIVSEYLKYGWIDFQDPRQSIISGHKPITLVITPKGRQVSEEEIEDSQTTLSRERNSSHKSHAQQEAQNGRLMFILNDPHLRSLFKDFLRANFCEENLDFWIDYATLRRKCRNQSPAMPSQNQRDLLDDAYGLWNMYLAPRAENELNVDHQLRQEIARLVNALLDSRGAHSSSPSQSLRLILKLFDRVEGHILRLMASDSVPKFVKTTAFRNTSGSDGLLLPTTNTTNHCENTTVV